MQSTKFDVKQLREAVRQKVDALPQRELIAEHDARFWTEEVVDRYQDLALWHATRAGGFGGSQIEHSNRYFDKIVAPYRPKLIVFYAGGNRVFKSTKRGDELHPICLDRLRAAELRREGERPSVRLRDALATRL